MLFFVAGHTCPDITYDFNSAARYMFYPQLVQEHALKQIGHYLEATSDSGSIMKPSEKILKINSFPDANFAGMKGRKGMDDPVCAKSRTGFVIMVAYCSIMWQSKLQFESLSPNMEAEIIATAHSSCKLFPIMDGVSIMGTAIGLPLVGNTTI